MRLATDEELAELAAWSARTHLPLFDPTAYERVPILDPLMYGSSAYRTCRVVHDPWRGSYAIEQERWIPAARAAVESAASWNRMHAIVRVERLCDEWDEWPWHKKLAWWLGLWRLY